MWFKSDFGQSRPLPAGYDFDRGRNRSHRKIVVDLVREDNWFIDLRSLEGSMIYLNSISALFDPLPAGYDFDRERNR